MSFDVQPLVLEGATVRLEPLRPDHLEDLLAVADKSRFRFFVTLAPRSVDRAGMAAFLEETLATPNMLPFAQVLRESGRAIGMTSYLDIRPAWRTLEVGFTWIGREYEGTRVNPEAKLLLLAHAFETLNAVRVQLKTDARNVHSQAAIRKLGATYEGTLRRFGILPDGFVRDTVMFSILPEEWPTVKANLQCRIG